MSSNFLSAAAVSLIALFISACSVMTPSATAEQASATPTISVEAAAALARAEADVSYAKSKFALWTTAEAALAAAQAAARAGDSARVIKQSGFASSQVRLGLEQLSYPTTERK